MTQLLPEKTRPIAVRMRGMKEPRQFAGSVQAAKWLISLDPDTVEQLGRAASGAAAEKEPKCYACFKEFGALTWRHHCRECKHAFCDGCSPQKAEVSGYDTRQRVCATCFNELQAKPKPGAQ